MDHRKKQTYLLQITTVKRLPFHIINSTNKHKEMKRNTIPLP
uniref:Uncharacterized protein n=1 Tax=Setaria italica TaxID=4555 RepID=K3XUI5_SETIT